MTEDFKGRMGRTNRDGGWPLTLPLDGWVLDGSEDLIWNTANMGLSPFAVHRRTLQGGQNRRSFRDDLTTEKELGYVKHFMEDSNLGERASLIRPESIPVVSKPLHIDDDDDEPHHAPPLLLVIWAAVATCGLVVLLVIVVQQRTTIRTHLESTRDPGTVNPPVLEENSSVAQRVSGIKPERTRDLPRVVSGIKPERYASLEESSEYPDAI